MCDLFPTDGAVREVRDISGGETPVDELAQKPQRSYLVGFTAATVILVIVSSVSVTYYYSSSADLLTKDREILQLQALSLSMNATVLQ